MAGSERPRRRPSRTAHRSTTRAYSGRKRARCVAQLAKAGTVQGPHQRDTHVLWVPARHRTAHGSHSKPTMGSAGPGGDLCCGSDRLSQGLTSAHSTHTLPTPHPREGHAIPTRHGTNVFSPEKSATW